MLKKKNRLTTKEFTDIFKKGEKNFSKNFLFVKLNEKNINKQELTLSSIEKGFLPKISVAVSKKVERKAVNRVKSRRIIYRILQENFEKIPERIRVIFLITKPILDIDKKILKQEILKHLNS